MKRPLTMLIILFVERTMAPLFALFFLLLSVLLCGYALIELLSPILRSGDLIGGLLDGLNTAVVALAVYELAQGTHDQYGQRTSLRNSANRLRDGVVRFIGVACSALVLEALIMVIKYSQKELAGFLYYPVAIIIGAGVLLMSLGAFTRLTESSRVDDGSDRPLPPREPSERRGDPFELAPRPAEVADPGRPMHVRIGEWPHAHVARRQNMWVSARRVFRDLARPGKTKGPGWGP